MTIKIKRNYQNSVFTDLFSTAENQLKLYKALHPEDENAREEDISDVTLEAIFVNNIYNDLGFTLKNKTLFLIEAQSTWAENIALRAFMYLGETYKKHINKTK